MIMLLKLLSLLCCLLVLGLICSEYEISFCYGNMWGVRCVSCYDCEMGVVYV